MTDTLSPTERWMREHHPDRVALAHEPHRFVPIGPTVADHACTGSCFCDRCWEPKSDRVHSLIAKLR